MAGCRSCGSPAQKDISSVQNFADSMSKNLQELQVLLIESERFKVRLKRIPELQSQYDEHLEVIRCVISEYLGAFENPFYNKVKLHLPEAAEIFNNFKLHLLTSGILTEIWISYIPYNSYKAVKASNN